MSRSGADRYELYYWPEIQGRGEFVRLALEDAAAPYVDVGRLPKEEGGGVPAILRVLGETSGGGPHFAPPVLKSGNFTVSQTPLILMYLGPRLGLVPADETSRLHAHQLMLTIADFVVEAHDTHHPLGSTLYYEDQKPEAARRAATFVRGRLPKFFGYFERVLGRGGRALGREHSYVDLALFQIASGLSYAFPNAIARARGDYPRLFALHDEIAERPNVAMYLASERRIPFNEHGIFRHYPELDPP